MCVCVYSCECCISKWRGGEFSPISPKKTMFRIKLCKPNCWISSSSYRSSMQKIKIIEYLRSFTHTMHFFVFYGAMIFTFMPEVYHGKRMKSGWIWEIWSQTLSFWWDGRKLSTVTWDIIHSIYLYMATGKASSPEIWSNPR